MTPLTPERRGARERLVTLAHSLPADKTLRDPQHGELNRLLDLVESEAVDRRLAELREELERLRWKSDPADSLTSRTIADIRNDTLDRIAPLLTSDARDRSPE